MVGNKVHFLNNYENVCICIHCNEKHGIRIRCQKLTELIYPQFTQVCYTENQLRFRCMNLLQIQQFVPLRGFSLLTLFSLHPELTHIIVLDSFPVYIWRIMAVNKKMCYYCFGKLTIKRKCFKQNLCQYPSLSKTSNSDWGKLQSNLCTFWQCSRFTLFHYKQFVI